MYQSTKQKRLFPVCLAEMLRRSSDHVMPSVSQSSSLNIKQWNYLFVMFILLLMPWWVSAITLYLVQYEPQLQKDWHEDIKTSPCHWCSKLQGKPPKKKKKLNTRRIRKWRKRLPLRWMLFSLGHWEYISRYVSVGRRLTLAGVYALALFSVNKIPVLCFVLAPCL